MKQKRADISQISKKVNYTILKHFTIPEKKLSTF